MLCEYFSIFIMIFEEEWYMHTLDHITDHLLIAYIKQFLSVPEFANVCICIDLAPSITAVISRANEKTASAEVGPLIHLRQVKSYKTSSHSGQRKTLQ